MVDIPLKQCGKTLLRISWRLNPFRPIRRTLDRALRDRQAHLLERKLCDKIEKLNLQQFEMSGVAPIPFRVHASDEPLTGTDAILRKEKGKVIALINLKWGWRYTVETRNKIACYAYWFHQTSDSVREITVDGSDGNFPSVADFKFSSRTDQVTLLPDAHFFRDHGYAETEAFGRDQAPAWNDRSDDIVWRGAPHGDGLFSIADGIEDDTRVIQRLRMAKACQKLDVDFRFAPDDTRNDMRILTRAGLTGEFIPTHDWGGKKFAIDIDGFTNAWCNFMQRLKLGCCVLKVESAFGFRQWYYDSIRPWEHFVPIKADLSDLAERIDWVRSNPEKAREIAANGQAFSRTLTFESESAFAIRAIEEAQTGR